MLNGYKFINSKTSKVVVSRDAVFLENPKIDNKKEKARNSSVNLETSCNDTDSEVEIQDNNEESEESEDEEDTDHEEDSDAEETIDTSQNRQTESEREQTVKTK